MSTTISTQFPVPAPSSTAELIDRLVQRTDNNAYALTIPDDNELSLHGLIAQHDIKEVAKQHGIKRIDVATPINLQGSGGYQLARRVCDWVLANCKTLSQSILEKGVVIRIQDTNKNLAGDWLVRYKTEEGCLTKVKNLIPFFASTPSKTIVPLTVEPSVGVAATVASLFTSVFTPQAQAVAETPPSPTSSDVQLTIAERVKKPHFGDEFTQLATRALQRIEKHWVYSSIHRGQTRFIASPQGFLSLEEIPSDPTAPNTSAGMTKEAVRLYKQFLITEFGQRTVEYIQHALKIDFDTLPMLYPDHVFKCNIAALDVHMQDADLLFQKLRQLQTVKQELETTAVEQPFTDLFMDTQGFSLREIRGLHNIMKKKLNKEAPTIKDFYEFINALLPGEISESRQLPITQFNTLLSIIMPTQEDHRRAYTGREIIDRPIMGFHTMGDQNDISPTRDVHEHHQIFEDIKKMSMSGFFEALGHVSVKKTALRSRPLPSTNTLEQRSNSHSETLRQRDLLLAQVETDNLLFPNSTIEPQSQRESISKRSFNWYTGMLLPAPSDVTGEERWYYVEAIIDDNQGLVQHILRPACDHYTYIDKRYTGGLPKPLPIIFVCRSTNSATNGISSYDSLQADLNPFGAPGSLNPYASKQYQLSYLQPRTIPLWVGYLLRAQASHQSMVNNPQLEPILKEEITSKIKKYLLRSLKLAQDEETKQTIPNQEIIKKFTSIISTLEETDSSAVQSENASQDPYANVIKQLEQHADTLQELPKYKIEQDIAYVGHSLGGALSQQFLHHYGPKLNRIPSKGSTFICYSSDGPATDVQNDVEFMEFGRVHRKVLSFVNQRKWIIQHQLEYGDFVPQSGGNHLGTEGYSNPKNKSWLDFSAAIFRPLPTAVVKEICAAPTHGRRLVKGLPNGPKEGVDYMSTTLTQAQLYKFDHAWLLGSELANIFGYAVLSSPKLTEWIRQKASQLAYLGFRGHEAIYRAFEDPFKSVPRDQEGVMNVCYTAPILTPYTTQQLILPPITDTTTLIDDPSHAA